MIALDCRVELTLAQLAVVEQSWDARTLVTAGAGAGKTTTLTYRLEHLTREEGLEAFELLVLSFSRAAVRELRGRVDKLATTARRVRAQTFDGWATSLLSQAGYRQDDLNGLGFDRRIELATGAIEDGAIEQSESGPPAHVVVDEVQDLVGVRREMVEALLDRFSDRCGFTVVGDAAQSIYGFQVSDPKERGKETNRFFDWVRRSFPDDLNEITLQENFRARTADARRALPFGARLQSLPVDPVAADREGRAIHLELRSALLEFPDFGGLDDQFVVESLRCFDGSTAILCRDNGQVLMLSQDLNNHGVPHRIQRSVRERPAPAWIAELLRATSSATLSEARFIELTTPLSPSIAVDIDRAWRALRRIAGAPNNLLNLQTLRQAVIDGRMPDEICTPPTHELMLSSVHRAKGLEFDRVLIVEPEPLPGTPADVDAVAEARLLYVAMTRARDDVYRISRSKAWFLHKGTHLRPPVDRWYGSGRARWMRSSMEASARDVSHETLPGAGDLVAKPVDIQAYLSQSVRSGDEVELRKLHDLRMSDVEAPPYGIFHGAHPIGETSGHFRADLWRLLKRHRGWEIRDWPERIIGLRVDFLETVVGHPAITEQHHMGSAGVWLVPSLSGLGRFVWPATYDTAIGRSDE